MARIVISSTGTFGDILPFVELGKKLQARGHDVCLAVNPAMLAEASQAGLLAWACGAPFGEAEARAEAAYFNEWEELSDVQERELWPGQDIEGNYRDLLAACRGADLLVASWLQVAAPLVHEKLGLPFVTVVLQANQFDSQEREARGKSWIWQEWLEYLAGVREKLGFDPLPAGPRGQKWSATLVLVASSRHFSAPPLERHPQAQLTGFWFAEDPGPTWRPDPELAEYLESGPPPLLLTFGSLPVPRASEVLTLHHEAARKVGRRLLVQRGWANLSLSETRLDGIFITGRAPHGWLFPRVAAVIHHGGIGTLAQALRCGCPVVVEPYAFDQFFNARRVLALQVGTAMHPYRLTAEGLAQALEHRVLPPQVGQRVRELAELLRTEDGLGTACRLIERQLGISSTSDPGPDRGR